MVLTIVINTVAGLMFMLPLLFVLPDLQLLIGLSSGQPVPIILLKALGSAGGAFGLLVPLLVLGLICGIGCTTAASRATWAFARDGAIPASHLWKKVDEKLDVPFNAMMLSMVIQIALGIIYFGSSAAFNAFSGVGVITLTTAYAVPIVVSLIDRRQTVKTGSFYLGKFGLFANIVAIGKSDLPALDPPMLTRRSLDLPRHPAFLYAVNDPGHSGHDELRVGGLLRLHPHFPCLVHGMGT